jgi:two-component system response regulator FixJ
MASKHNVYIVDDDEAVRDSLATLLISAGLRTTSFASAYGFLQEAASLEPGCLISDVRMPEMDGITLLHELKSLKLDFPVVLITGHGDIKMAVQALKAGAVDFVEKPYDDEIILAAVRGAQKELDEVHERTATANIAAKRLSSLTARERDVLEFVVVGLPNKIIAHRLGISPRTVEFHRSHLMTKMQARGISQLVRFVLLAGLKVDP